MIPVIAGAIGAVGAAAAEVAGAVCAAEGVAAVAGAAGAVGVAADKNVIFIFVTGNIDVAFITCRVNSFNIALESEFVVPESRMWVCIVFLFVTTFCVLAYPFNAIP